MENEGCCLVVPALEPPNLCIHWKEILYCPKTPTQLLLKSGCIHLPFSFRCMQQKKINFKIALLCPSVITLVSNHSPSFTYEQNGTWRGKFSHYQMISKSGWSCGFAVALTLMCHVSGSPVRDLQPPALDLCKDDFISNLFISGPVYPHSW